MVGKKGKGYSSKIKSEGRNGSSILNVSFVMCKITKSKYVGIWKILPTLQICYNGIAGWKSGSMYRLQQG